MDLDIAHNGLKVEHRSLVIAINVDGNILTALVYRNKNASASIKRAAKAKANNKSNEGNPLTAM